MTVPLMFQPLAKYAQFEGRSRRSEFWLWVLLRFLIGVAMAVVALALLVPFFSQMATHSQMDQAQVAPFMGRLFLIYPLYTLVGLGLLLPTLAVAVRRLHDTNRSGLWLLMPVGVAVGGLILLMIAGIILAVSAGVAAAQHNTSAAGTAGVAGAMGIILAYVVYMVALFAAEIVMLVFFVTEGTKGPNRFGPDPKAISQPEVS